MNLRPYQEEAVNATFEQWKEVQSTLCVLPTAAGKTVVAAEIIRRIHPGRAIFICHRGELVTQAYHTIKRHTGLEIDIEKAEQIASTTMWGKTPVIIATIQTLCSRGGRMRRFDPQDFSLLVADESHHSVSPTWSRVINYFKTNTNLKILNLTATPDRADEEALGKIIDSVAYDYEILQAIEDGWIVPVEQQMINIEGLDFSGIRTTAGDLNGADLAAVMEAEKTLHGIVDATIREIGEKRTLVFAASVKQAEMYAEIFNRHRAGMADWVCGKTPEDKRAKTFKEFKDGTTQVLCNVGIATEGVDIPAIEVIVMGRPTKSRALYSQMAGRSFRPIEEDGKSIVDAHPTAEGRRVAIELSSKRCARIIDFVGNSGRHKLITAVNLFGGKFSDEILERATAKSKKDGKPVRMDKLLEEELLKYQEELEKKRLREAARKVRLIATSTYTKTVIDPFGVLDLQPYRERAWDQGKILSEKQINLLRKQGINPDELSYSQGSQIIRELFSRWNKKLCTLKQAQLLKRRGINFDAKTLSMKQAGDLITEIATREGWRKKVS